MYKYTYVEASAEGFFHPANHRELIDKYSSEGWRFVSAIPSLFGTHGVIKQFDLVFEKEEKEE
ncbi:DUF4177 domain-containing protein [Tepidibacter hydrothermalis]|uniref:DUF4177 domain-containing protein n=1 Tax=Tepidibacter hydrothermalis TaxID=3036126 RepID=A0ABY8EAL7_9FIRM|nr:DUF4177 domain-containing protein [Tepidibacter hydrothermalis]WFD09841.1 DUF4177 domain-containing protein [Tepidibacter hydrothermalis]